MLHARGHGFGDMVTSHLSDQIHQSGPEGGRLFEECAICRGPRDASRLGGPDRLHTAEVQ